MLMFECEMCQVRYEVDDDLAGKTINCRECGDFGRVLATKPSRTTKKPSQDGHIPDTKTTSVKIPETRAYRLTRAAVWIGSMLLVFVLVIYGIARILIYHDDKPRIALRENFLKIQPGMAAADVTIIMGKPSGIRPWDAAGIPLGTKEAWCYDAFGGSAEIYINYQNIVIGKNQYGLDK
jgi:hypothetical protein